MEVLIMVQGLGRLIVVALALSRPLVQELYMGVYVKAQGTLTGAGLV